MRAHSRSLVGLAASLLVLLTACAAPGVSSIVIEPAMRPVYPMLATYPDIQLISDIAYGDDASQTLDVCLPTPAKVDDLMGEPRPVIVSIHGGSWMRGDKSDFTWRAVCQWFAAEGFVTVSVNYRLAPANIFPAAFDDVQNVVRWIRDPAQVQRFALDPGRIGAFGGSAGGNLAALLGTQGSGDWTTDSRVAAVVDLSGPNDVRAPIVTLDTYDRPFGDVQLAYLGCTDFADCPAAAAASPVAQVDATDPPFFVAHSLDEFLPLQQSESLVATLHASGVPATYVTVAGSLHSIAMLDAAMKQSVIAFLRGALAFEAKV